MPNNLDLLFNILTTIANPIKGKLERNETVIKILKQFNLAPEHPPADFSGVYIYALVEYGVAKPKCLLEFFRQEDIKKAFRKAFDHYNPSILLGEVEAFVDAYALGDEIKELQLDVMREVAAFATIFIEVAKNSRTSAEVLTSHQIASLHQRIILVQEQLDRLPTLEGIRTEMARLAAAEEDKGSGEVEENFPQKSPTPSTSIALAQEMRGWFETLGYRFERYEVWQNDYFEWIINIPVRRNRYDRVLVRGMTGEVGLKDVQALDSKVSEQKTDEGWLVTDRRISKIARDEIEKQENEHLECFTFDELVAIDADFSGYLDWLEAEVKRKGIDKNYVPLACTKEELDPDSKRPIGVSRYTEEDGWIEGYIDRWLDDPAKEHISILGEFGTGKTWFALHYAWVALQRYKDAQHRGVQLPRLPLVIPLRDYAKAVSVESLFSEFFFRQYKIPIPHYDAFIQLNRMGKLLLIFDGFDEMAARINRQEMINNFWELAKVVVPGAKVILTCRTEHFPEAQEGRALLNAELQASIANLTGETPQFEVLELEKFDDNQIRQVLSLQTEATTVELVMGNSQLLDLARRPVLTELILEALPDIAAGKPVDMSRVYLYAVQRKMERDIKAERTFTSLADKMYFLCELAWEMLSNEQMSLNYRLFPDRIRRLFGSVVQEEKDLDHWHYDMMGQTMLIRNADGDYTPAHRSLLEFFVAYKFAAELGVLADDFTELVKAQSCLDSNAAPVEYTWSGYFERQLDENGCSLAIAPLRKFVSEPLEKLKDTFGRSPLTKAVIDLIVGMVNDNESLIKVIEETRGKKDLEVGYVGGNAATLAVKVDKAGLEGKDLSGSIIKEADFVYASLKETNFTEANLNNCAFPISFGAIFTVAYSPDGEYFATGDSNSEVILWRVNDHQPLFIFKGHTGWVRSVVFSPDGQKLISGSYDCTVKIWDIKKEECIKTCKGHINRIHEIAISPDGKTIASGSTDQSVKLWNIETGECIKTLDEHIDSVRSVAISSDNKTLASVSNDKSLKLWDITTRKCIKTLEGHTHKVRTVIFSPDGNIVASGSYDHTVKLWNFKTGECLKTLQCHTDWVRYIAFNSNGKILASVSYDQTAKLWDVETGECLKVLQGHTNWIRAVAFSPNDTTLITAGDDQTIRQWDLLSGECIAISQGCPSGIRSVTISPDNTILATSSEDQTLKLWNIGTGKLLKSLQGHTSRVNSAAFNPDGKTIASVSYDKSLRIWDINTGKCRNTLYGHSWSINGLTFSSDGNIIATGGGTGCEIKLWDSTTGECLNTLYGHKDWIWSVSFSPDNTILASGSNDRSVKLWKVNTGECVKTLEWNNQGINTLCFSPDGKTLAIGCTDNTIKLWDINSENNFQSIEGHTNKILSVVFSPDGRILASGSVDETVKLWDIQTKKCLKTFHWDNDGVHGVAISSDGKILAAGGRNGIIKIWNIQTGECIKTLSNKPYANMNITNATGLTPEQKSSLKALGAVEDN